MLYIALHSQIQQFTSRNVYKHFLLFKKARLPYVDFAAKGRTNLIRQKMGGLYSSILSFTLLSHTRNYRVQRTRFVEFAQLHKYNSNFHFAIVDKRVKK